MYQSIALSVDTITAYQEDFSSWYDAVKYFSNEKEILVKKIFKEELSQLVDKIENKQIAALIINGLENILPKLVYTPTSPPVKVKNIKNKDKLSLLTLADKSSDRILIMDDERLKLALSFNQDFEVYICSSKNYVNPQKDDIVANPRDIINIKENEEIDPYKLIFPYTKIAHRITIRDPYPPIGKTQNGDVYSHPIWEDFLQSCRPKSNIIFKTVSDKARKNKIGSKYNTLSENDIRKILEVNDKKNTSVKVEFSKNNFHDRTIETEHFHIKMGGGIGMFYKKKDSVEYVNHSGDGAFITVTHINKNTF